MAKKKEEVIYDFTRDSNPEVYGGGSGYPKARLHQEILSDIRKREARERNNKSIHQNKKHKK